MSAALSERVRLAAGLFPLERGILCVRGEDRVRWLNGMISNDIASLVPGHEHSGCYATLLTPKGRIVADMHVLLRGSEFWLEIEADAVAAVAERLERYIIADDVELADVGDRFDRFGLEGPNARAILESATGAAISLAQESNCDLDVAGTRVVAAAFGWTGEAAFQLFAPTGSGLALAAALRTAGESLGLVDADADTLEVMRVEAGIPRLGAELDEEVFPDEARLDRAISSDKGCYTGQEIVARLRSRGQVNHLLVGLRFSADAPPPPDSELHVGERRTGEVTSVCLSPREGAIGLGYVRREHATAGTELTVGGQRAVVAALPIVSPQGS